MSGWRAAAAVLVLAAAACAGGVAAVMTPCAYTIKASAAGASRSRLQSTRLISFLCVAAVWFQKLQMPDCTSPGAGRMTPHSNWRCCLRCLQAGDTYYDLAGPFETDIATIVALNPGVNKNRLKPGQVGNRFDLLSAPDRSSGEERRRSQPQSRFGCTSHRAACLWHCCLFLALQVINVPCLGPCNYTAAKAGGDSLPLVALYYKVDVAELLALNPGLDPTAPLAPGQVGCRAPAVHSLGSAPLPTTSAVGCGAAPCHAACQAAC